MSKQSRVIEIEPINEWEDTVFAIQLKDGTYYGQIWKCCYCGDSLYHHGSPFDVGHSPKAMPEEPPPGDGWHETWSQWYRVWKTREEAESALLDFPVEVRGRLDVPRRFR